MKLVIEMPEKMYHMINENIYDYGDMNVIIQNGIPLDTHDEEIIAETVESIWGKPPYTELLDKIKNEIEQKQFDFMDDKDYDEGIRFGLMLAYQIIDKHIRKDGE